MPRIRKKTSNRVSTNDRKKVLHKVRESRKKKAKAAKKNPQWKSKKKKDPGIPNNFPYKDQILAEVAEQRRMLAEEKSRRKGEKKATIQKNNDAGIDGSDDGVASDAAGGSKPDFDGIASLSAKRLLNVKAKAKDVSVQIDDEDEEPSPMLMNCNLPNLKAVLDEADVVLEVLDARDPLSYRSSHVEELISAKSGKHMLLILNKIDVCPREAIASWAVHLRTQHPTLLFRSASLFLPAGPELINKTKGKGKAKESAEDGIGVESVLACLGQWAKEKKQNEPLVVAVVGLTNAGKSSFINTMLGRPVLPTYTLSSSSRDPTTTTVPQEVELETVGKKIRFIDTPGLSWQAHESTEDIENVRARDILVRNRGRIDRLKDPVPAVAHVVSRSTTEDLMVFYSLPAFSKGDVNSFLSGIARSCQLVKKRGALDLAGAARIILRDWSTGKFPRYTTPAVNPSVSATESSSKDQADVHVSDESILANLKTRKEMRKGGGLVKLISGEIETRKVAIEEPWTPAQEDDSDDEDEDEDADAIDEDEDEDEDEARDIDDAASTEDDVDDGKDDSPSVPNKRKRKHSVKFSTAPPNKKAIFAAPHKGSKTTHTRDSQLETTRRKLTPQSKDPSKSVTPQVKPRKAHFAAIEKEGRKVANTKTAARPRKEGTSLKTGRGDDEAYDFGKFF